jgi:hypothetical protein
MKYFKQKINNSYSKPIVINLIAGNYKLISHDNDNIEIEGSFKRTLLVTIIKDEGDFISIKRQKLYTLIPKNLKKLVVIKVPTNSKISFRHIRGNLTPEGTFESFDVNILSGKINVDLEKFQINRFAHFQLYSGIINLFNVASRTNTNNKLRKTLKIDSINGYNIGANVKYGNIVEINASDKDFALKDSNT